MKMRHVRRTALRRPRRSTRLGAMLSFELLLILPIVGGLVFAVVEFGLIWSASNQIKAACYQGCRVGTLPANDPQIRQQAVETTVRRILGSQRLIDACEMKFTPGEHSGDPVVCEIAMPMHAASPDLLAVIGFRLNDRYLTSRCEMRHE